MMSAVRSSSVTVLLAVMIQAAVACTDSKTVVNTRLGPVQGRQLTAVNGESYWSFRGIPYAKPPIGQLRFAKPEPRPYSAKLIDATLFGASCIQDTYLLSPNETISEDCLFLNIYTKDLTSRGKKVLVWIHGGAFISGSGVIYDAGSLVTNENIIVVTVNYRLGILGFLSTEDGASLGNFGLWDQVLAIKWVKNNIAAFGGDPTDITLAGESAGGASVSLLSLSPMTKGLFTKVYSQSGFAASIFAHYKDARSDAASLANKLNCPQLNSREMIDCLRSRPVSNMAASLDLLRSTFVPRADGELIPMSPMKLIKDYDYLQEIGFYSRDYFLGLNNNEKTVIAPRFYIAEDIYYTKSNASKAEKNALWKQMTVETYTADRLETRNLNSSLVDLVDQWYANRYPDHSGYLNLLADVSFYVPAFDMLDAISHNPSTKVWLLYFNHFPSYLRGSDRGMSHGLDLLYWFDISLAAFNGLLGGGVVNDFSDDDVEMKKMYTSIVAQFVKGRLSKKGWPTYTGDDDYYLDFSTHPVVMKYLYRDQRLLWQRELQERFNSEKCD